MASAFATRTKMGQARAGIRCWRAAGLAGREDLPPVVVDEAVLAQVSLTAILEVKI